MQSFAQNFSPGLQFDSFTFGDLFDVRKNITGKAENGRKVSMTKQVADAHKVLASTAKVCDAGNIQMFTKDGG